MYLYAESDYTLQCLTQLRQELRKLLLSCSVCEPALPRHSLFSSRRMFRTDELHVGLSRYGRVSAFSVN